MRKFLATAALLLAAAGSAGIAHASTPAPSVTLAKPTAAQVQATNFTIPVVTGALALSTGGKSVVDGGLLPAGCVAESATVTTTTHPDGTKTTVETVKYRCGG